MDEDVHPNNLPEPNFEIPAPFQRLLNIDVTDALVWLTRLGTVLFGLLYILPMFGLDPESSGSRVLITSAIANSLKLHAGASQLNREGRSLLRTLWSEDSFHFLLYATMMLLSRYISLSTLAPPFLFAVLQITPFTVSLLNILRPDSMVLLRSLIGHIDNKREDILQSIAVIEVVLFPMTILHMFTDGLLVLPYSYYYYLKSRYQSPRNPYSRRAFRVCRQLLENTARHQYCPVIVSHGIHRIIEIAIRMAPIVPNVDNQDSD